MNRQMFQRNYSRKVENKGKKNKGVKKYVPIENKEEKNSQGPALTISDINEQKGII